MELKLQLFKIPLFQDCVFKGQGKLHELNGSLFNIWFELTGAASDPLVLLLRYRSIVFSLIDGSTEAFHMLPTDNMLSLAKMYEIHGSSSMKSMVCVLCWKCCGYVKCSEYVTLGFKSISNEILEFIR
jgi:hypothetical protein